MYFLILFASLLLPPERERVRERNSSQGESNPPRSDRSQEESNPPWGRSQEESNRGGVRL